MSAQPGKKMIAIIYDDDSENSGTTISGLHLSEVALDATSMDATDMAAKDFWRILLDQTGTLSARITASGLFCDTASDTLMQNAFFSQSLLNMALCIPDFGNICGRFKISDLGYVGTFDTEIKFSFTLMSAGSISFQRI